MYFQKNYVLVSSSKHFVVVAWIMICYGRMILRCGWPKHLNQMVALATRIIFIWYSIGLHCFPKWGCWWKIRRNSSFAWRSAWLLMLKIMRCSIAHKLHLYVCSWGGSKMGANCSINSTLIRKLANFNYNFIIWILKLCEHMRCKFN